MIVLSGVISCGMVWYGMVWYGMVWYGMVWYGMVWYFMLCLISHVMSTLVYCIGKAVEKVNSSSPIFCVAEVTDFDTEFD